MSIKLWLNSAILFTVVLSACYLESNAQVLQSSRFEIPLALGENFFEITPAQNNGLFLYRNRTGTEEDRLEIIKLDTAFHTDWHGFLPVEKKHTLIGKRATLHHLYFLFRYQDFTKKDFTLFAVQQDNGNFMKYTVRNFITFMPSEFQLTKHAAIIGGYFNRIPVVIYFSFQTLQTKILPGLFNETGELTQIKTYPDESFDVLISSKNFQGQKTIWIKNYDPEGNILRSVSLKPEGNKHLIFARSLKTSDNTQLVAGVYGGRNSEYSKGLFIARIHPAGAQQIRYYNYGDLQNFFKYMKVKRETRVKSRIERRKIKGKKVRFNYRFLVHELVPYKNQYVLLGEAFYPRYVSPDRSYYSGYSNPYSLYQNRMIREGRVFDGYRYTHAVVIGFNADGELLWDNSFEINDVKAYTLEQFVKLEMHADKIALLYVFHNQLRSKIIKDNTVIEGKTFEPIQTYAKNEIIKPEMTSLTKLEYWYSNYFFAYGIQEIVNPQAGNRRVFFITKVGHTK